MDKTVDQLYTDAIALVKEATGLTLVIRGDENGPKPQGEYASLLLLNHLQRGMDAVVYSVIPDETPYFAFAGYPTATPFNDAPFTPDEPVDTGEVNVLVSGNLDFTFSLQFYRGDDPLEHGRKMFRYPQTPWGADFLTSLPLVVKSISNPASTNYEVGEKWIKRSTQQLVLVASSEESRTMGVIHEASVITNKDETHTVTK